MDNPTLDHEVLMHPGAISSATIAQTLFETPSVINLSNTDYFEVQPGVYSSVYVNLKALASSTKSRKVVAAALTALSEELDPDYICGMELGGCYFASSVADALDKSLLFCRKENKKYNIKTCFAGNEPEAGSRVVIIDDVLSSGNTIARGISELHAKGCEVYVVCIFSYCWEAQISERLGAQITPLCDAEDLIAQGIERNEMSEHNVRLIREYIVREEQRLVRLVNNADRNG